MKYTSNINDFKVELRTRDSLTRDILGILVDKQAELKEVNLNIVKVDSFVDGGYYMSVNKGLDFLLNAKVPEIPKGSHLFIDGKCEVYDNAVNRITEMLKEYK